MFYIFIFLFPISILLIGLLLKRLNVYFDETGYLDDPIRIKNAGEVMSYG